MKGSPLPGRLSADSTPPSSNRVGAKKAASEQAAPATPAAAESAETNHSFVGPSFVGYSVLPTGFTAKEEALVEESRKVLCEQLRTNLKNTEKLHEKLAEQEKKKELTAFRRRQAERNAMAKKEAEDEAAAAAASSNFYITTTAAEGGTWGSPSMTRPSSPRGRGTSPRLGLGAEPFRRRRSSFSKSAEEGKLGGNAEGTPGSPGRASPAMSRDPRPTFYQKLEQQAY